MNRPVHFKACQLDNPSGGYYTATQSERLRVIPLRSACAMLRTGARKGG